MSRNAFLLVVTALCTFGAGAQGFPNVARTPGELIEGPIAPEQGRTAIIAWHGDRIVSVPEAPGSQDGADLYMRVVNLEDLDTTGAEVTVLPARASGFHAHGYFQSGEHLFVGPHCLGEALDDCNGTYPHDVWGNSLRIGGPGTAIGDSQLRRADIESETGLLLGSVVKAGAQAPWGLNDYWTYNTIGGDAFLAVRRGPGEWVYDWNNGGDPVGPAIRAMWDHLGLTGVTGFPFIMGNILIWASDQAGTGVASYDISDLANPVLLDVLKDSNPGGYWPEVYGDYIFFPRRDGEGGVGSQAGFMVVDFSDPTDLRIVANRNLPGSNQYVTFQDEFAFMNRYKIDMRTFEVAEEIELVPGVLDASQFALPVGNLLVTGGYGSDGPGLAVWAHQAEPDTRGPYVAGYWPKADQTNYPLELPISMTIPETLRTETIVDGVTLILQPVDGTPVATWHSFGQGKLLTITPQDPLLPDTTYELILTEGIQDAAGNGMDPFSFRFSTGDGLSGGNAPPSVTGITTSTDTAAPGVEIDISWTGTEPDGDAVEYRIDFGDGSPATDWGDLNTIAHTYTEEGHYQITVQARDEHGAVSAFTRTITVISPPTLTGSTASAMLALDEADDRLYVVNPDTDTVSAFVATTLVKLWEVAVGTHPTGIALASDGTLWVTCRDSDTVEVLTAETGAPVATLPLNYGARPVAIVAVPGDAAMLATCEGDGTIRRFDVASRLQTGNLPIGPSPRAIAVTSDGARALVTRFISGEHRGEVYDIDLGGGMALTRTIPLLRDHSTDGAASGRGVPNYLAGIRISPDGAHAWVVAKKDNTTRGTFFSPLLAPGQDNTVRAMLMLIDLGTHAEAGSQRLDIDNSESPSAVAFSPLGDYAFIGLQGNAQVGVLDVLDFMKQDSPGNIQRRLGTGLAPQSLVVGTATGRLYANNLMGRSVTAFNLGGFFASGSQNISATTVTSVAEERMHPEVRRGKEVFYDASDPRMSAEGYISCATCHIDGSHDGRTWEFTNRGEGFRNTTDLRGRSGMGHGLVHWSANFDEIQDFENDIRNFFGGTGFLSDSDFAATSDTLGAPKAGLSSDLDAMAAYVSSLGSASLPRSPFREANGALSEAAVRGAAVFTAQGCAECHVPTTDFTDGLMHDVGTLRASSGNRLGGPLTGIDTPTLLGLHASAPYFHNGSAATLAEVFAATGGQLFQAEDATMLGGASAQDVGWYPMKEWHGSAFAALENGSQVRIDGVETAAGGAGQLEVRYCVQYGQVNMQVSINEVSLPIIPLATTPNQPSFVPNEWRTIRIPVTFAAGSNSVAIGKVSGGALSIDDVLIATPEDLAAASAHRRSLAAGDLADLSAYLLALDGTDGAQPAVAVSRVGDVAVGGTDTLALPAGVSEQVLTYTIQNTGAGPLNLGQFYVEGDANGTIVIQEHPAAQVLSGESTSLEVYIDLSGETSSLQIRAWSDAPGLVDLGWTIAATATPGEGEVDPGEPKTADQNGDFVISLTELLRVIQFYNLLGLHCAASPEDTEDGYIPGVGAAQACAPHDSDYSPQDWTISLSELLRLIQLYNSLAYHACPGAGSEDGYCPGP